MGVIFLLASVQAVPGRVTAQTASSDEDAAKGKYRIALSLMRDGSYKEAGEVLKSICDNDKYSRTSVGDDALLQLARYYFETERNLVEAQRLAKKLVDDYGKENAVPGGYLLRGRMALSRDRSPESVRTAIGQFKSAVEMFADNNEAVSEALYRIGEAYRLSGRPDEAMSAFGRVCSDYSQSPWCAGARLGLAASLVRAGQWQRAIEELQRVRNGFPESPESSQALRWNTILHRLYVLPSLQRTSFKVVARQAPGGPLRNVLAMAIDPGGRLLIALKSDVRVADQNGTRTLVSAAGDCTGLFLDPRGGLYAIQSGRLVPEHGEAIPVSMTRAAKSRIIENIPAAGALSTGEFLISDPDESAIQLYSEEGKYLTAWKSGTKVSRLAVNEYDEIAVLEREEKSVTVLRRMDGGILSRVPTKIAGFVIENPVDIAYDSLGHVYVLDRDSGSVVVFAPFQPNARPVLAFSIPEKTAGAFTKARAFAVDPFGRLAIFDDRLEQIQSYQ